MQSQLNFCIEMDLPAEERDEADRRAVAENPPNRRCDSLVTRFWRPGRILHVRFVDGASELQVRVQAAAGEWVPYARVGLRFGTDPNAEVRITFSPARAWSYVGTDALLVPPAEPTFSLGGLTEGSPDDTLRVVVLHAFGHALSLEDQPPPGIAREIVAMYAFLGSLPPLETGRPRPVLPPPPTRSKGWLEALRGTVSGAQDVELERAVEPGAKGIAPDAGAEPPPAPSPTALCMDVAVPERVKVAATFRVAVAVRQPASPVLAIDGLSRVGTGEAQVLWPAGAPSVHLRVSISAPDCDISGPDSFEIQLLAGRDSPVFNFLLRPRTAGAIDIVVTLYQEEASGSTWVQTASGKRVAGKVRMVVQSQSADAAPAATRPGGPGRQLPVTAKIRLVTALLGCPTMSDPDTRDTLVENLPDDVKHNVRRNPAERADVLNLVNTALKYPGGLEALIEVLRFNEGDSLPMQAVDNVLAAVGILSPGG